MNKEYARQKAQKRLEWAKIAEKKAEKLQYEINIFMEHHDFTEPIKLGHHSQRKHEKLFEKRDSMMRKLIELDNKAKEHRTKAENLLIFANRNKGDAEKRHAEQRELADKQYSAGSPIYDPCYGNGIIQKVNKKTFTIEFKNTKAGDSFATTRDKSYFIN